MLLTRLVRRTGLVKGARSRKSRRVGFGLRSPYACKEINLAMLVCASHEEDLTPPSFIFASHSPPRASSPSSTSLYALVHPATLQY